MNPVVSDGSNDPISSVNRKGVSFDSEERDMEGERAYTH